MPSLRSVTASEGPSGSATAGGTASRDLALDGLRGVAALIVLTSHLFVAGDATFADATLNPGSEGGSTFESALTYTPLHFFWGGYEAVIVFFVLSGYVLTLPVARGGTFKPGSYYPRRALRLYVPVWGALCLAAIAHFVVESSDVGQTWWLSAHTVDLRLQDVWQSVLLLEGAGTFALLAVLWSLHWEVVFSLLLPMFLLLGKLTSRVYLASAAAALAIVLFSDGESWARFMPCFALGTIMAFQHERIAKLRAARMSAFEPAMIIASVLAMTAFWWLRIGDRDADIASRLGPVLIALGACGLVTLAIAGPRARRILTTRPVAWSGTRSFSLYLVQAPIVVLTAFALGGAPTIPLLAVAAVPPVLLLTEGFYRAVERPSHRLSRRVRLPALRRQRL